MSQVRLRDSEKQILRGPSRDVGQRHRGLPSWPQSPALAPGFRAPEPGVLLSLCCPLVATEGKAAAEPGAPGGPGPVGAKCQTSIPLSFSAGKPSEASSLLPLS